MHGALISDIQACGLELQLEYRDTFAGAVKSQRPKISVVNGQTAKESRSKV